MIVGGIEILIAALLFLVPMACVWVVGIKLYRKLTKKERPKLRLIKGGKYDG